MCYHVVMNEERRIFAHALLVPEDVCREDCKVIKFTAISADGKRFCYEPDLNDYCRDGWQMWDAFAAFCKECGLTKRRGDVWFASSHEERATSYAPCNPCNTANCFDIFDQLCYLAEWETMFFEREYYCKSFLCKPRLTYDEFCKNCGYESLKDAEDVRGLYIKFKEDIDKDIYSRAECVEIVQYVHDNIGGIYGGADTRTWLDMQIFITHSLLRLARSARDIFEDVFDFLCDDCKKRNRAEQKIFYDFLIYLGVEYQVESREYFKGVLPPFLYTNKSGAWLKELELIGK